MTHMFKKSCKKIGVLLLTAILINPIQSKEPDKKVNMGLKTDFGDVLIENLGIGRTYTLRELAGIPLKVVNTSEEVVNLFIEVTIPTGKMISAKRKNIGVQPIPSLSWITLGQEEFILPPDATALTDVTIRIPDDPKLYGKKFQTSLHSRTKGENFMQLGVWSHLIFTITESPEKQAEIEKNRKRGIKTFVEFSLLPDKVFVDNVPMGRKFDIRKENKRTIKLTNVGETPVDLKVTMLGVDNTPISTPGGFEKGNPGWLKAEKEVFHLETDTVVDPGWTLFIPKDKKLLNRKFMLVTKVEPVGENISGFTFYGRIFIEIKEEEK